MKKPNIIRLNTVKESEDKLAELLTMPQVYIFSDEQNCQAYWREGGNGYTNRIGGNPGIWSGEDAWERTRHCGSEKCIEFEEVLNGGMIGTVATDEPDMTVPLIEAQHLTEGYDPELVGHDKPVCPVWKKYKQTGSPIKAVDEMGCCNPLVQHLTKFKPVCACGKDGCG